MDLSKMSCLTSLVFIIRPLLPLYVTWMTLCPQLVTWRMSSHNKPKNLLNSLFLRDMTSEKKWKMCFLFHSPLLLLLPYDIAVKNRWSINLLQEPRHTPLSQAWKCLLRLWEEENNVSDNYHTIKANAGSCPPLMQLLTTPNQLPMNHEELNM